MRNVQFELILKKFQDYLEAKGYSQRTINEYSLDIKLFKRYLDSAGVNKIADVTKETISNYQSYLYSEYKSPQGNSLSLRSQACRLTGLKSFFRYLTRHNLILHDITAHLEMPRLPKTLPRNILTPGEVKKMLKNPDMTTLKGFRDRVVLELLYSTGLRRTELLNLRVYDLDLDSRELRVVKGKGNKDRLVPISRKCNEVLREYLTQIRPKLLKGRNHSYLLISMKAGMRIGIHQPVRIVTLYAKKAKIKKDKIACHTFRHTMATHLLKGKADIRHIQELLGHRSLTTTQRYTRVEIGDLKRAIQKAHPRERME